VDFGDLESADGVDLSLPEDDAITRQVLRGPVSDARVRVGLPIWNKKEWVGEIYPLGTRPEAHLATYATIYDTVEVNSTFYAPPAPSVIAAWARAVPPDFRFCPKVWRTISHEPGAKDADIDRWLECVLAFGDRLGPSFLQLPPQSGLELKRGLVRLLDRLTPHVRLVLELRHPAWMGETRKRLFPYLAERGVGLVITDTIGRRDLVHMGVSADFALIRFKGHGLGARDEARMDAWGDRLARWSKAGLREAYFIAHERTDHERLGAPLLRRMGARLRSQGVSLGRSLEPPPPDPQLGLI